MARAHYWLELETDYNTWSDLTPYLHAPTPVIIERGITPGEAVATTGRMSAGLYNADGRFTPGHPAALPGFAVGAAIRLGADGGGGPAALFYGRLAAISARADRPEVVELVALDGMETLAAHRLETFPLLLAVRPGDLVNRLVDSSLWPPGSAGYWRLGYPLPASLLGESTYVAGDGTGKAIDSGQSVFPWAGDGWTAGLPIREALADVCASEGGWFFLTGDGTPVFQDRHARPRRTAPDLILDGTLAGVRAACEQARLANRVTATAYPRRVSSEVEVLWEAEAPIPLPRGQARSVIARYRDPQQQAELLGAQDVVAPVGGLDFAAQSRYTVEVAGVPVVVKEDVTASVRVDAEIGAAAARLTLRLAGPVRGSVTITSLRIRGIPLRVYGPVTALVEDEESRLRYGLHTDTLVMPLQDDPGVAADRALAWLHNNKSPRPWLSVTLEATADTSLLIAALRRECGDRLRLLEEALAPTGMDGFIEHIRHEITDGGAGHLVVWQVSPADRLACWILGREGFTDLDGGARLGY